MINQVGFLSQIGLKKVVAGANFSAGLTQDGRLYVWGSGLNGQLGLGSQKEAFSPCLVDALIGERVIDVQCGDSHTCVLCESGRVYGWGQGMARNAEMV